VADEKQKEIERLQAQLERERETVGVAKAEIARNLLGQVGHDAAIQKDLQQEKARAKELDTAAAQLRAEKEALELEIRALKEVQGSFLIKLHGDNVDAFLSNTTRPLKAVLFTTKPDTPPLWSALAEAQSTTTAFAIVHHIETALMQKFKLQDLDLPRICIYSSGKEPVVYDGEVKLDALSSFLRDTVQGGDAVIALRQQVLFSTTPPPLERSFDEGHATAQSSCPPPFPRCWAAASSAVARVGRHYCAPLKTDLASNGLDTGRTAAKGLQPRATARYRVTTKPGAIFWARGGEAHRAEACVES